jgi:hypothetical protein
MGSVGHVVGRSKPGHDEEPEEAGAGEGSAAAEKPVR